MRRLADAVAQVECENIVDARDFIIIAIIILIHKRTECTSLMVAQRGGGCGSGSGSGSGGDNK